MACLVAIQTLTGEWRSFVIAHPSQRFQGDVDVIGRKVPAFRYLRAWDGVRKDDAVRLANTLKGLPPTERRAAIWAASEGLRLTATAGTEA
jgi:hypothetical protein